MRPPNAAVALGVALGVSYLKQPKAVGGVPWEGHHHTNHGGVEHHGNMGEHQIGHGVGWADEVNTITTVDRVYGRGHRVYGEGGALTRPTMTVQLK